LESHRDVRSVNDAGPFDIVAGTRVELPFGATLLNGLVRAAIPVVDRWGNNVGQRRFDVPPEWFLHETSNTQDVAYHEARLATPIDEGVAVPPVTGDSVPSDGEKALAAFREQLRRAARTPGQKPEDTDEQVYIGIDHPGIQWIWDDLAQYAAGKHWCRQYDELAATLGIPGRKRMFSVSTKFGIYVLTGQVEARSQTEADRLFRKEAVKTLREALAEDSDEDANPAK
jgi:hypothetical protein